MYQDRIMKEGLTFDDVLLVPAYSEVLPREVSLNGQFSRHIGLNIPVVSAAMDTVTEAPMAIAIAREGGIGVIHKNMSIAEQAAQVRRVKRAENGMIADPVTIFKHQTIGDALQLMSENHIGGIPVVDKDHVLVGIVTNRDLRFETDIHRSISEVMTSENLVTIASTDNQTIMDALQTHKVEKLPVVDKNGKLIGLVTYKDITKLRDYPNANKDAKGHLRCAAGVGITPDYMDRVDALVKEHVDAVVLDSAHGHSKNIVNALRAIKAKYPELDVVVGNIATAEAAGVGVPQLTAIFEVAEVLKGTGVPLIADGGLRYSGDVVKALAAGGNCVMCGSMFAGTDEAPGDTIIFNGRKFKFYRGMGSIEAMKAGSADRYFQGGESNVSKLVPEGIAGRVPYKGSVCETIYQLIGGLRSGMGYVGAHNLEELRQARFVRITSAGMFESHPHDITITSEAPNYSQQ